MKIFGVSIYIIASLFIAKRSFGQSAVINDSKGYIEVREDTFDKSRVLGRIFADDIFWDGIQPYDNSSAWNFIYYSPEMNNLEVKKQVYYKQFLKTHSWTSFVWDEKGAFTLSRSKSNEVHIEGFVRQYQVQSIDQLARIKHEITKQGNALFWNDSIRIEIEIMPFNSSKHKIEIDKHFHYATKIDGKHPIMIDVIPVREFSKIKVSIHGKNIDIPKSQYKDLFDCKIDDISVVLDKTGNIYIYKTDKSDGGGYAVTWLIKNGRYFKRDIGGNR